MKRNASPSHPTPPPREKGQGGGLKNAPSTPTRQNRRVAVSDLSHIDAAGRARMVDVTEKPITERTAVAEGFVRISPALARAIKSNAVAKGNVLDTARIAGVLAAKSTDSLIPLCHSLPLDHADVTASLERSRTAGKRVDRVRLTATARTHSRTGVEMEALVAVSIAALTIIDMGKAIDPTMVIEGVRVIEKQGGRSGHYIARPSS